MNHFPGSSITIQQAIKESMVVPISDIKEVKYRNPIILKCTAIEDAIRPDQIIIDSYYLKQKFKVIEVVSGKMEKEFNCDYTILIKENEKPITIGKTLLLIIKDDKPEGVYHLLKALTDKKENQDQIKENMKKLSYLIN